MEDEKRRFKENDLLKHEGTLRRYRVYAEVLFPIILATKSYIINEFLLGVARGHEEAIFYAIVLLVVALGYQSHLQIHHIESIKMYRRKIADLKAKRGQEQIP